MLDLAEAPSLPPVLQGKGVALIFEKPSNRTRQSMEMAVVQLGGHPVYTEGDHIGLDQREPVDDVARVMAGYHAVLAARVIRHDVLERMAAASSVPVVNLLSDRSHPMQALADVLTMRQTIGPLARRTVAWLGDYNNVARSLGEASAMLGMHVRYGLPDGYGPDEAELERLQHLGAATVRGLPPARGGGGGRRRRAHRRVDVDGPGGRARRPRGGLRGLDGDRGADGDGRAATRCSSTACPCTAARRWRPR